MGRIKSALEIALERTESVKSDKGGVGQFEAKQQGKRLANAFLAEFSNQESVGGIQQGSDPRSGGSEARGSSTDPLKNLADEIKNCPENTMENLKQGIFDVLIPQISLPNSTADMTRIGAVGKCLLLLINEVPGAAQFANMYKQFLQLLSRYLDEITQYDQAIRQQYAPKLRQKEEELSRRMGREVRLDPYQDPEFVAFYNQNINALKANYQAAADQVRDEALRIWEQITAP